MNTILELAWSALLTFLGSCAPGILFNINRNKLIYAGIGGSMGWVCYVLIQMTGQSVYVAAFIGSVIVGLYSDIMARVKKAPSMMFYIPGIIPLVPGYAAYCTILYLIQEKNELAKLHAIKTVGLAVAICFGLIISSAITLWIQDINKKRKIKSLMRKENDIL